MEKSILKLGQMVTDNVTGIKGMLTMYSEDMDNNVLYLFQPSKLNPETKEPVDRYWLSKSRVDAEDYKVELPLHILGTVVEDKATGFKGVAISIYYHISGCVHIEVKPKGLLENTGQSIKALEFDLRRLKGEAIVELSEAELEESKVKKPSPESYPSRFSR